MDAAEPLAAEPLAATPDAAEPRRKRTAREVLHALRQPKVGLMLALGFSSGLPFMLVGNTFNYWLGDVHVDLALIGFASWVGLSYTLQFLLAAVVDNLPLPWIARLGRRRSWMLVTQVGVAVGLFGMAVTDPRTHLAQSAVFAVVAAFASATQDVAMNAWRIETAVDGAELDLLTSAYSLGYRTANILTQAVILFMAQVMGWAASYAVFAALMGVGVAATLAVREPANSDVSRSYQISADGFTLTAMTAALGSLIWQFWEWRLPAAQVASGSIYLALTSYFPRVRIVALSVVRITSNAVFGPLTTFFKNYGVFALLVLLTVTAYHLCDYLRGPMISPFYVHIGLSKPLVASLRLSIGLPTTLLGIAAGGLYAARFGHISALIVGGVLQPLAVASFAILAFTGPQAAVFGMILGWDDFCTGFAGVVLIAYISTLTSLGYTATQYALLVSAVNLSGKTLKGFSGVWVKGLTTGGRDLTHAYAAYFVYAALVGIPALGLVLGLAAVDRIKRRRAAAAT